MENPKKGVHFLGLAQTCREDCMCEAELMCEAEHV